MGCRKRTPGHCPSCGCVIASFGNLKSSNGQWTLLGGAVDLQGVNQYEGTSAYLPPGASISIERSGLLFTDARWRLDVFGKVSKNCRWDVVFGASSPNLTDGISARVDLRSIGTYSPTLTPRDLGVLVYESGGDVTEALSLITSPASGFGDTITAALAYVGFCASVEPKYCNDSSYRSLNAMGQLARPGYSYRTRGYGGIYLSDSDSENTFGEPDWVSVNDKMVGLGSELASIVQEFPGVTSGEFFGVRCHADSAEGAWLDSLLLTKVFDPDLPRTAECPACFSDVRSGCRKNHYLTRWSVSLDASRIVFSDPGTRDIEGYFTARGPLGPTTPPDYPGVPGSLGPFWYEPLQTFSMQNAQPVVGRSLGYGGHYGNVDMISAICTVYHGNLRFFRLLRLRRDMSGNYIPAIEQQYAGLFDGVGVSTSVSVEVALGSDVLVWNRFRNIQPTLYPGNGGNSIPCKYRAVVSAVVTQDFLSQYTGAIDIIQTDMMLFNPVFGSIDPFVVGGDPIWNPLVGRFGFAAGNQAPPFPAPGDPTFVPILPRIKRGYYAWVIDSDELFDCVAGTFALDFADADYSWTDELDRSLDPYAPIPTASTVTAEFAGSGIVLSAAGGNV